MYSLNSKVRYSECDANSDITIPALVNYLQDCCTFQSEDLNIGVSYLKSNHTAWVLTSWQINIKRYPKMGEKICISTWPYDIKAFFGYRNFTITDKNEHVIAYANSVWVYMDTAIGKPLKIPKEIYSLYTYEPEYPMGAFSRKVEVPLGMEAKEVFKVQKFYIDTNNHVNNEKYILMALEYLTENVQVKSIRVEYKTAAVLGDIIYPYVAVESNKIIVLLGDKEKKPYAIVEFSIYL